jgi:hypothetical protein
MVIVSIATLEVARTNGILCARSCRSTAAARGSRFGENCRRQRQEFSYTNFLTFVSAGVRDGPLRTCAEQPAGVMADGCGGRHDTVALTSYRRFRRHTHVCLHGRARSPALPSRFFLCDFWSHVLVHACGLRCNGPQRIRAPFSVSLLATVTKSASPRSGRTQAPPAAMPVGGGGGEAPE